MKFSCCHNGKTKSSLLKSSDTIYSLLCATYLTYASNKEKLTSATEILKDVSKEYSKLEESIKEKRDTLRNFKLQQKRIKNEKAWFKTKISEYNGQTTLLQERETQLQQKKDGLKEEFQRDKTKLDQLAEELGTYLNFKTTQLNISQTPAMIENDSQDENDLKALLTDVTDSEVTLTGPPKEQGQPTEETVPLKHLPPKTPRSKSLPKSKPRVKQKNKMPESAIQNLICEDLIHLHNGSDEEVLFTPKSPKSDRKKCKNKLPRSSCSGVTIVSTSESMVSWFPPASCHCKSNSLKNIKAKE